MAERVERERRIALQLPVHLELLGRRVAGLAANISRRGIYVRIDEEVPLGEVVELAIALPSGRLLHVVARAVHRLDARTARKLGRFAGVGFQFLPDAMGELHNLARLIDQAAGGEPCAPLRSTQPLRILIAESDARLLSRMTTILDDAGYLVESASNGVEAYSLCLERRPDLLLCAERIPLMSGQAVAAKLARDGVNIPTSFVHKPFTDADLRDRVEAALQEVRDQSTAGASLAALLSSLEASRKSGIVTVSRGSVRVELRVRDGSIVRVAPASKTAARQRILDLLEWSDGRFEFQPASISDADEVGCSISRLLFDHARLQDHLMEVTTSVWQATM
jgi:CheY-like chemotaxis protein